LLEQRQRCGVDVVPHKRRSRRVLSVDHPTPVKRLMKTGFGRKLVVVGTGLVAWGALAQAGGAPSGDSEESPLYANSRAHAFAEMSVRDRAITAPQVNQTTGIVAGDVIVAEGTSWRKLPANGPVPAPMYVTTGYPTCGSGTTCGGAYTCSDPPGPTCSSSYPTCAGPTCDTGQTCGCAPTCCPLYSTCSMTCSGYQWPTCSGATCNGATCLGTCVPAHCQTALYGVNVPKAGQIQFSFSSSAQLRYVLQCCTNAAAGVWTEACWTNGNGSVTTLCHTNGAPMALYRLLILESSARDE